MPVAARGEDGLRAGTQNQPKVVAHFLDHKLLKGFALDFRPSQEAFLLRPRGAARAAATIRVRLSELKALFFVKDFDGDPTYHARADATRPSLLGQQVSVRFRDGEVLRGTSPSRALGGSGFFLVPIDPRSNNRRVFVLAANALECRLEKGRES